MSLRAKVLLLFAVFAVGPLVLLAAFDYIYSVRALTESIQAQNQGFVARTAEELNTSLELRRSALRASMDDELVDVLRGEPAQRLTSVGRDPVGSALAAVLSDNVNWIRGLELRNESGERLASVGRIPTTPGCSNGRVDPLTIHEPVPNPRGGEPLGTVVAHASFARVFPNQPDAARLGAAGTLVLRDRESGRVLRHRSCEELAAANASGPPSDLTRVAADSSSAMPTTFRFLEDGEERLASVAAIGGTEWQAISIVRPRDFTLPYIETRLLYLQFILVIGLLAAFAFNLLLKRSMRSLGDLTDAADEVAAGNLTPWMPVPTGDEIGRLSTAFGRMTTRLRELIHEIEVTRPLAALGEFAAQLSHEVRNPLSSIRLNLQEIQREVRRGNVDGKIAGSVDICLREIERLDGVVHSALGIAREESESVQDFRVHDVVEEALDLMAADLDAKHISVHLDMSAARDEVRGDAAQIKGVIINLLRNGMEAMSEGGAFRIWTETAPAPEGPIVRLHVADRGPGIPPSVRNKIFQPFFTTRPDGTGLGLARAVDAVQGHGGRIYLEQRSELERGAEFVVELPLILRSRQGQREPTYDEPEDDHRERLAAHRGWRRGSEGQYALSLNGSANGSASGSSRGSPNGSASTDEVS